ncbi:Heat shock cognate 70 kDa protein, partial [Taenia solium]
NKEDKVVLHVCRQSTSCAGPGYEGERAMADIPFAPRGALQIEATFDFDANSVLRVSGAGKLVKKKDSIIITTESDHLLGEETERMLDYTKTFKQADGMQRSKG